MDREQMLATIDALYAERIAGRTGTMATHLAPGATYRMAGEGQMQAAFGSDGPADFLTAMTIFNQAIAMRRITRIAALAEGNRLAMQFTAEVQFQHLAPFETEIFNLWSFDEAGKVTDLVEFVDTARLVGEVQLLGGSLV